jgi:hypothetical protein
MIYTACLVEMIACIRTCLSDENQNKNTSNIRPPTFKTTVVPCGGKICELKRTIIL